MKASTGDALDVFRRAALVAGHARPDTLDTLLERPGSPAIHFDTTEIGTWPGLEGRLVLLASRTDIDQLPNTAAPGAKTRVGMGNLVRLSEAHIYRAVFPVTKADSLIETKLAVIEVIARHFITDLMYAYGDALHVSRSTEQSGISKAALDHVVELCRRYETQHHATIHGASITITSASGTAADLRMYPRIHHPAHGVGARFDTVMPSAPPRRGYEFVTTMSKVAHPVAELGHWHIRQPGWRPARRTFLPGVIADGLLLTWLEAEIHHLRTAVAIYDREMQGEIQA